MPAVYTIFINNKPFIITADWDYLINNSAYQHYYDDDLTTINKISREFLSNKKSIGLILHAIDSVKVFETFCSSYEVVEAAGGIVENELEQLLFIFRKGCWDLPKGKIEKGETEILAAKREVMEECGLQNVEVRSKIATTYHTFFMSQKNALKISHWYSMTASSNEKLIPQLEEDITDIKWFLKSTLDIDKLDTYKSIFQVLSVYLNKI